MTSLTPAMRAALRPPERVTVSEWADRHILLDETSAEPGPYRTSRTPYVREWQDSAALPWVHQVTIQKSTQVGGSVALLNVLAWAISQDPGPITWVMPTREDAAEFGENRVLPMVSASAALRAQLTGERWDAKRRQIRFKRCRLLFRSARVPKELAQYAARWLFGDEAGKWPQWTQEEAAPWDLARERTRTFWNHRVYLNSTPTTPGGLISVEFDRGDRRRFHVPCPHCGSFQVLRWQQVKFDVSSELEMRAKREARYECDACGHAIADQEKAGMLSRGVWVPEGVDLQVVRGHPRLPEERHPHRSYHLWAGYSPWLTWWEIAAEFLRSKGNPASLQNFINSWLGEAWVEKVEDPRPEMLKACVGGYRRGEVPDGVQVLTAMADVQKRYLAFVIRGWGVDNESWLIDHGRVDNFAELEAAVFLRAWPRGLAVRGMFVDARYRTEEVMAFCRRRPALCKPSIGVERDDPRPFGGTSRLDRHPTTGAPLERSLVAWHVNTGYFKDLVAVRVRTGGAPGASAFHLYEDVDDAYLQEMSSEHKVLQRSGTRSRERWVPKHGRAQNHFWDCEVGAAAMAQLLGVDRLREIMDRASARSARPERQRPPGGRDDSSGGIFGGLGR